MSSSSAAPLRPTQRVYDRWLGVPPGISGSALRGRWGHTGQFLSRHPWPSPPTRLPAHVLRGARGAQAQHCNCRRSMPAHVPRGGRGAQAQHRNCRQAMAGRMTLNEIIKTSIVMFFLVWPCSAMPRRTARVLSRAAPRAGGDSSRRGPLRAKQKGALYVTPTNVRWTSGAKARLHRKHNPLLEEDEE